MRLVNVEEYLTGMEEYLIAGRGEKKGRERRLNRRYTDLGHICE